MGDLTLIKLGGSLLTLPDLSSRIARLLIEVEHPVILVGGGASADLVRELSVANNFDERTSHDLAIAAMSFNARLVESIDDRFKIVSPGTAEELAVGDDRVPILDPQKTLDHLELSLPQPLHLKRSWNVTSDSIAAWIAAQFDIRSLLLVKSVAPAGGEGERNALLECLLAAGQVDKAFPDVVGELESFLWCNLRDDEFHLHRLW